jgi:hypothetical protein
MWCACVIAMSGGSSRTDRRGVAEWRAMAGMEGGLPRGEIGGRARAGRGVVDRLG